MTETQFAPVMGPYPKTPDWFKSRKNSIGASEAAAACGLSPWEQPLDIYLRKTGQVGEKEQTDAMRLGLLLEPIVIEEYAIRNKRGIHRPVCQMIHPDFPFISATPDAMTIVEPNHDPVPLEAKTATFRRAAEFGDEGTDQIPADYVCQAQQQICVTGAPLCIVAVLLDGRTLRSYQVDRHDELIEGIVAAETELWERIQRRDPPEPNWTHPRALQMVRNLYDVVDAENMIDLPKEAAGAWDEYEECGAKIKTLKELQEAKKAEVLYAMKDAGAANLPHGERILVRREVHRRGYEVKPTSWVELRARKVK